MVPTMIILSGGFKGIFQGTRVKLSLALNGTSQGPTTEDARKNGHIRGRSHAEA